MIRKDRFLWLPLPKYGWARTALTFVNEQPRPNESRYIFDFLATPGHILAPREMNVELPLGQVFSAVTKKPKLPHMLLDVSPRPGQHHAFHVLRHNRSGLVNAAPGKGKTILGLFAAINRQEPFVVVCPNLGILGQWEQQIREKSNITKICQMHSRAKKTGNADWREAECLLTTPQTLSNIRWSLPVPFYNRWGTILYDECHHVPAENRRHSLYLFDGVRIGLSATIERRDDLDVMLHRHIGPVIWKDLSLPLTPRIVFAPAKAGIDLEEWNIETHFYRALTEARLWNSAIDREIDRRTLGGRRVLVVTHIREHAERLAARHAGSGLITGLVDFDERHLILKRERLTFGTFNSVREALDAPLLDTIIFVTPFHVWSAFFQGIGRVSRTASNKRSPLVVVMEPSDVYVARSMLNKLRANIKMEGYEYSQAAGRGPSRVCGVHALRLARLSQ